MRLSRILRGFFGYIIVIVLGMLPKVGMADGSASINAKESASKPAVIELDTVEVKAKRVRVITPLPGFIIDRGQSTTNIQSASGKEIAESKAINVTEFMNSEMQSVSVNDYAGNPFQQELNFRGFSASPAIGTPQGISVYLDGVRINEAFGDVVNWDLIPMNALSSLDLIPGTNPMFGLNTLGGALALRTKTGFTDAHARGQYLTGAWGRQQVQVSNGVNVSNDAHTGIGLFTAYNHFKEDGWRKNSPSNVRQLFNNVTLKVPLGEVNFSALNIESNLTGNGLIPFEAAAIDREQVFTSPDESKAKLDHYNLNARVDLTDTLTMSVLTYKRKLNQSAISADLFESYKQMINAIGGGATDIDGDGVDDIGKLNGMFNFSQLNQDSRGSALQLAWDLDKHQIVTGVTTDANSIKFMQSQALGELDASHNLTLTSDPVIIDTFTGIDTVLTQPGIIRNNLNGSSTTKSVFFTDTWSPTDTLHITYGARYNWTNVQNTLVSDRAKDLHNFVKNNFLPQLQRCALPTDTTAVKNRVRFLCSEGDYDYRSFNPSLGIAWEAKPDLTMYGNISRGARTPTVIELGCAKDHELSPTDSSNQRGCSIPTSLSADPYLKQIRSTSYEAGTRGSSGKFDWNIGVFRTELKDDILFVPVGRKNRGVFDNFGETLRQGIEMGIRGDLGADRLSLNYTFMRATYESPAQLINENNSSNTSVKTVQSYVNVEPGDQLPGMPNHIIQASWNHKFSDRFDATLSMIAHSSAYVRGNENNEHSSRAGLRVDTDNNGEADRDIYDYIGAGKTAGYGIFNLRANYKFDHGMALFLKVDNLFDKNYSTAGDLGKNAFDSTGAFIKEQDNWTKTTFIGPGAPRAIWVGLSVDLDWKKIAKSNQP